VELLFLAFNLDHPEVPMNNNEAEHALRLAALGRKNYYGTHFLWSGLLSRRRHVDSPNGGPARFKSGSLSALLPR
jgi:hypothetical protein